MAQRTEVNECVLNATDTKLGGDIEAINPESEECKAIVDDFEVQKEENLDACKNDLNALKSDCEESQEGEGLIEEDEEKTHIPKGFGSIQEGEIGEGGKIEFFFDGKSLEFYSHIIQKNGIGYSHELHDVQNLTLATPTGNFVIQDGYVYDWSKSMEFYINRIKDYMGGRSPHSKYHDILQGKQGQNLSFINFKNYQKNIHILSSILDLELSKNTLNDQKKRELLIKSAESLNLTYEIDKIYIQDLEESELLGVVEERLSGILDKGLFLE